MSIQMMSDLLEDLSTEQQQIIAGGTKAPYEEGGDEGRPEDDESDDNGGSPLVPIGGTRLYKIKSRSLVRVRRLR
jgi:hypothetical protein